MRIQISTIVWVSLSALLYHHNGGCAEAAEVYSDCPGIPSFLSIPFTGSAYDSCIAFHDKSEGNLGDCGYEDDGWENAALDGQRNTDPVCAARYGECHVAFTEPGEYLEYAFEAPDTHGPKYVYNIILRVASSRSRRILVSIDNGGNPISKTLTAPAKGFAKFEDLVWERVQIPRTGPERIIVEFLDGFTNFCSIRVEPTTTSTDKSNIIPFDASAQKYISFVEKSLERLGSCGSGLVDSQPCNDSVCKARGGSCNIGWTERDEQVIYEVINAETTTVQKTVTLRLASYSKKRRLSVEVEGYPDNLMIFTAPGKGYGVYEDFVWSNVSFPPGRNRLIIKFFGNGVNLCSVSVK